MKKMTIKICAGLLLLLAMCTAAFAEISMEQAKKIALAKIDNPNARLVKEELDTDDYFGTVYEFKYVAGSYKYKIKITTETGKVVKFKKESRFFDD